MRKWLYVGTCVADTVIAEVGVAQGDDRDLLLLYITGCVKTAALLYILHFNNDLYATFALIL